MKFLIASDIHGSATWCRKFIDAIHAEKPDKIILLGDILYHGPRNDLPEGYAPKEALAVLNGWSARVVAVRGNCDAEVDLGLLPFPVVNTTWLEADGLRIFVSHGHHLPENPPCPGFKPGTVFLRGHTHVPRGETLGGLHFWNPGSLSLPKSGFPRSYGLYENGLFRVLDMQGKEVLRHTPA